MRAVMEVNAPLIVSPHPQKSHDNGRHTVTLLSANLWHDWPRYRDQQQRLEKLAELIEQEQVDIALLQEVARRPAFRVDEWLTQHLGMAYAYSQANGHEAAIGFEEGVAIFSRFPLHRPRRQHLGQSGRRWVRRLALGVDVKTPLGLLSVFSGAHLWRILEARHLRPAEHAYSDHHAVLARLSPL